MFFVPCSGSVGVLPPEHRWGVHSPAAGESCTDCNWAFEDRVWRHVPPPLAFACYLVFEARVCWPVPPPVVATVLEQKPPDDRRTDCPTDRPTNCPIDRPPVRQTD